MRRLALALCSIAAALTMAACGAGAPAPGQTIAPATDGIGGGEPYEIAVETSRGTATCLVVANGAELIVAMDCQWPAR